MKNNLKTAEPKTDMLQYIMVRKVNAVQDGARAEKERIRQETRMISGQLDPAYRKEASESITRQVLALPWWQAAKAVMIYWSLPEEPDTRALMETALREKKHLLLPRCLDGKTMTALPLKNLEDVEPGHLGIPAPRLEAHRGKIPEPDLIIVPCVTASPDGVRLGHGAGYYDRFLAEHPAKTVCLCFRSLQRASLPAEETDILMDLVITD